MQVTLVQEASALDPAENRERLAELTPSGSDLVVFPEAFARDFGEPGSDLSDAAEPLDGPFAPRWPGSPASAARRSWPGCSRPPPTRTGRSTPSWFAARRPADYRKTYLYDSFGYRESDRLTAGPLDAGHVDIASLRPRPDDLLRPALPRVRPALVAADAEALVVPAAWVPGPRKEDHWTRWPRARAIENTAYVVGVGQPGPRYTGHSIVVDPLGEVLAEAGEKPETLTMTLEPESSRRPGARTLPWTTGAFDRVPTLPARVAPPSPVAEPNARCVVVAEAGRRFGLVVWACCSLGGLVALGARRGPGPADVRRRGRWRRRRRRVHDGPGVEHRRQARSVYGFLALLLGAPSS